MWKGGGGVPPLLCCGRLQKAKIVQKEHFFPKIIAQKRCKYQCFCFFLLVAMGDASFEFVAIYGVLCMCFVRWFKNTVKYSVSGLSFCQSVANSGVFATCAFLVVAKIT